MQPVKSPHGLYIVRKNENFVYWCAWREWYALRCNKGFFPPVMTVWQAWPPETMAEVASVIAQLNEARKVANADMKIHGPLLPMLDPVTTQPWERWSVNQILDYERKHREDPWWEPELPPSGISRSRPVVYPPPPKDYGKGVPRAMPSASAPVPKPEESAPRPYTPEDLERLRALHPKPDAAA